MTRAAWFRLTGVTVELICPNVVLLMLRFGFEKFTLLNKLKNEVRNCRIRRSWILVSLVTAKSRSKNFGPWKKLGERMPTAPGPGLVNTSPAYGTKGIASAATPSPLLGLIVEGLMPYMVLPF